MNIYLINALVILLVVRQVREHQLDLRAMAVPVLAVAAAAVMFCTRCPAAAATSRWTWRAPRPARPWARSAAWPPGCARAPAAAPLGRAGVLAAGMWIAGVGARMVFYFAATHGAGPAIAAFSIAYHITGPAAWTAALVMMALADVTARLVTVWMRGRSLAATAAPVAAAPVPAGSGA